MADKGKKGAERDDEEEELWKTQPGVSLYSLILNLKKFLLFVPFYIFYDSKYTQKSSGCRWEWEKRSEGKKKLSERILQMNFFLSFFCCVFQHFLH